MISQGVLHHTSDPLRGFKELVRICKPNGFVAIYLYNKWNHWRHNLQKQRVNRLAGDDVERRFDVAYGLYGNRPLAEMSPADIAGFYDQYCHPHKSDHTVGETLGWFDAEGLQYWGSYPPLGLRDLLAMAQLRGRMSREYPGFHTRIAAAIVGSPWQRRRLRRVAAVPFSNGVSPIHVAADLRNPGSRGKYSGGPALCGRKVRGG